MKLRNYLLALDFWDEWYFCYEPRKGRLMNGNSKREWNGNGNEKLKTVIIKFEIGQVVANLI